MLFIIAGLLRFVSPEIDALGRSQGPLSVNIVFWCLPLSPSSDNRFDASLFFCWRWSFYPLRVLALSLNSPFDLDFLFLSLRLPLSPNHSEASPSPFSMLFLSRPLLFCPFFGYLLDCLLGFLLRCILCSHVVLPLMSSRETRFCRSCELSVPCCLPALSTFVSHPSLYFFLDVSPRDFLSLVMKPFSLFWLGLLDVCPPPTTVPI